MKSLSQRVADFLRDNPEQRFTSREIAHWILMTYPEESEQKKARSANINNDEELISQYVAEIGSIGSKIQKQVPEIRTTEGKPRKYFYSEKTEVEEIISAESLNCSGVASTADVARPKEYDLYAKLVEYLTSELRIQSKRIDERKASNSRGPGGNRWLYPDIVGLEDLTEDWEREIKDCVSESGDKKLRLWSFEVKILLNRSNVRECFFQAVSNSSWANFAYLVAGDIEGRDTLKELRILSSLHGIGVMRLDESQPSESEILLPARERSHVDWNAANRLASENSDFKAFVKQVWKFHRTGA